MQNTPILREESTKKAEWRLWDGTLADGNISSNSACIENFEWTKQGCSWPTGRCGSLLKPRRCDLGATDNSQSSEAQLAAMLQPG